MSYNSKYKGAEIESLLNGASEAKIMAEQASIDATIAKNAVTTLEGLANANEATQTLAGQVVQIEENKQKLSELDKQINETLSQFGTVTEEIISNDDFVLNSGYLSAYNVGQKATIESGSSLRYSNPVAVLKGDVVEVESQGTGIACIATTDANGSTYTAKAISNNSSSIVTYTYEVEEDGYIAISSRAAALKGKVLRKIGKDRLGDLEKKVTDIDNDIQSTLYKEIIDSSSDMTALYTQEKGQAYGTVGSSITIGATGSKWRNIKINSTDGVGSVSLVTPSGSNPSSVIQYVDSNDIIISLAGTGLKSQQTYEHELSFPEGASAVYVNGTEGSLSVRSVDAKVEKVNIIGNVDFLNTSSKIIVDAINEVNGLSTKAENVLFKNVEELTNDITVKYLQSLGQSYGTVGNKVKIELSNSDWRNIKINSTDGIRSVSLVTPSGSNPSSVIQYVDSNDIIISLAGTGLKSQQTYEHELSFPEGASAVYVSSLKDNLKVYSQEKVTTKKKVNVIGDVESLKTDSKVIVEAINEVLSVYPTIEEEDMLGKYVIRPGQRYGTVGSVIQLASSNLWSHIKIQRADNISFVTVSTLATSANVSSLVQYVDDNDTVIELAVVKPSAGVVYKHELSFPECATAVYVSSLKDNLGVYKIKKLTAPSFVGNPSYRFRVLSWNIGHYAKGNKTSSGITAETYEREKKAFRKVFNSYAADIVGLCEYSSIFYDAESATDAILSQYPYAYIAPTESGYVGTALYSCISLTNREEFSLGEYKAYEGRFVANGKEIVVCMAHLPWQSQEQNLEAINTLLSRYEEIPYVVIMGDFNWNTGYEEADAKLFTEAGYQLANWGYLGKILTSYNNVQASNYLDNVAVKGGCILHTEVLQNTPDGKDPDAPALSDEALWDAVNLSDHFPIICDIVF